MQLQRPGVSDKFCFSVRNLVDWYMVENFWNWKNIYYLQSCLGQETCAIKWPLTVFESSCHLLPV